MSTEPEATAELVARPWWRPLAQFGFWFFLLKGLLWLIVPALFAWGLFGSG